MLSFFLGLMCIVYFLLVIILKCFCFNCVNVIRFVVLFLLKFLLIFNVVLLWNGGVFIVLILLLSYLFVGFLF